MKFLTTSVLALTVAASGAMAQNVSSGNNVKTADMPKMQGELIRSRDITDAEIYTLDAADDEGWNVDGTYTAVDPGWNQIGEIEDIILSEDGKMIGIVAEVGGFLDIADKHVAISIEDVKLVPVDDRNYVYVTRFSEEELEAMEGIDEGFWN